MLTYIVCMYVSTNQGTKQVCIVSQVSAQVLYSNWAVYVHTYIPYL